MATNPMQRKARRAFILGVVLTVIIAALIIYYLNNQIKELEATIKKLSGGKVGVYVLNQDVESGQTLTQDMFLFQQVDAVTVPANATNDIYATLQAYSLCDSDGNTVYTGKDNSGNSIMYTEEKDGKHPVIYDPATGIYKKDGKEIKLSQTLEDGKPLMSKISLKANTIITGSMIVAQDEWITDDYREQTYNMISLPIDLETEEYVDIRFMLPNGLDYIVLSKQKVIIPDVAGVPLKDTIKLRLSEGDLATLSSAIVEAYQIEGAKLYAIKYIEAGTQEAAVETYVPMAKIKTQIERNPNIVATAMKELRERWTIRATKDREDNIDKIEDRDEDASISGLQESTQATQEKREEYLSSLYGG